MSKIKQIQAKRNFVIQINYPKEEIRVQSTIIIIEILLLGHSPQKIKTYILLKTYTVSQEKNRETKYDTFTQLNTAQKQNV